MKYFIHAFKHIFDYTGRARRAEFGWFVLTNFLLQCGIWLTLLVLTSGMALFTGGGIDVFSAGIGLISVVFYIAMFIYGIFTTFIMFSLTARRLHDLGWSGWWQLIFHFSPFVIFPVLFMFIPLLEDSELIEPVFLIRILVGIFGFGYLLFWLILLFKDGQKHPNKYGESPKYA